MLSLRCCSDYWWVIELLCRSEIRGPENTVNWFALTGLVCRVDVIKAKSVHLPLHKPSRTSIIYLLPSFLYPSVRFPAIWLSLTCDSSDTACIFLTNSDPNNLQASRSMTSCKGLLSWQAEDCLLGHDKEAGRMPRIWRALHATWGQEKPIP